MFPIKKNQNYEEKKNEELKNQVVQKQTSQSDDGAFKNVFAVINGKKNTELESSIDPCEKVYVLDDNWEKVNELKALIDTRSHVSLTSWSYALKREWKIFETNTKLCSMLIKLS